MRHSLRLLGHVSLLALILTASCHRRVDTGGTGGAAAQPAAASPTVSDANAIAIVLAANNTDLSYARLVPARSTNAAVQAFAVRMTTDHTLLNARVGEIALRNSIVPEENTTSLDFRDHSAQRRDILRELQGIAFDTTYAANEVQYHTELLEAIDKVLAPSVRSTELREFVKNLRPAVSAHLAHAQEMRASLTSRK